MSTPNLRLEVIRFPKIGSVPEMDREATLQREPTCQAGGKKKNIEMQQCGVVPKGADISYAPRLTVTAPRTRGGPEMVSSDQFTKNPPIPKTYRLQVEGNNPGRDELLEPARGRGEACATAQQPQATNQPVKPEETRQ